MHYLTTPAIVLHRTRYSDRYSIVHLYTQAAGRLGVLVPERSSARRSTIREYLRPLAEVEVTLGINPKRDLASVQEVRALHLRHSVHSHPAKGAQAIFLSEFLYRILTTPQGDESLYRHLAWALAFWEEAQGNVANFHLCLLLRLLPELGIAPSITPPSSPEDRYFSLSEQCFFPEQQAHCLGWEASQHLPLFLRMDYDSMHCFRYGRAERAVILDALLDYYRLHLHPIPELKCLAILRQLGASLGSDQGNHITSLS